MPDLEGQEYVHFGYYFTDSKDDERRPLVRCDGCGAVINGGHLSRTKHDNFHKALADLFSKVIRLWDEATIYDGG